MFEPGMFKEWNPNTFLDTLQKALTPGLTIEQDKESFEKGKEVFYGHFLGEKDMTTWYMMKHPLPPTEVVRNICQLVAPNQSQWEKFMKDTRTLEEWSSSKVPESSKGKHSQVLEKKFTRTDTLKTLGLENMESQLTEEFERTKEQERIKREQSKVGSAELKIRWNQLAGNFNEFDHSKQVNVYRKGLEEGTKVTQRETNIVYVLDKSAKGNDIFIFKRKN